MRPQPFRARSPRLRLAWLAVLGLLFQQVALAAYACPISETPPEPQMVMVGCGSMEMPDPQAPALCDQHCLGDHLTTPDLKVPQVASPVLLALDFALTSAFLPPVEARYYQDVPTCRSDPPPAQRFCSLQI